MISIITPVYQAEKYIENLINSIINQTYHDWEVLLIDDGSTDGSAEICDCYEYVSFIKPMEVSHQHVIKLWIWLKVII